MLKYLAKRIGRSILTLFIIVTLVFCLLRLMPVEGYFANYEKMTEAQIQAGLQSMGLLDPLPVQIGRFWVNMLHGDLGVSHIYKVNASVTGILAKKLPISIQMGVYAMLLSLVIGIPMGLFMGRFKSRWPDKLGTAIIVLIQAVPAAVYYLYIQMYGTTALNVGLLFDASNWKYWVLPVCSMSLGNVAFYAMWLRRYMVDESNKDYVRLARAKGVSENNIALRHIFRNAMVPLVQYIPSAFLNTVVGSIYIESLYSIPGMGGLLVTCVQRLDNTMVQGLSLIHIKMCIRDRCYMIPHDMLYNPDHFKNCRLPNAPINDKLAFGFSVPGTHNFPTPVSYTHLPHRLLPQRQVRPRHGGSRDQGQLPQYAGEDQAPLPPCGDGPQGHREGRPDPGGDPRPRRH